MTQILFQHPLQFALDSTGGQTRVAHGVQSYQEEYPLESAALIPVGVLLLNRQTETGKPGANGR